MTKFATMMKSVMVKMVTVNAVKETKNNIFFIKGEKWRK